jgi:valyl-tRNA synthetase
MPFITEEVWQHLAGDTTGMLIAAQWPDVARVPFDDGASDEMEWAVEAISAIRALRAELNVPPSAKIPLLIGKAEPGAVQRIKRHEENFARLARVDTFRVVEELPPGAVQTVIGGVTLILALGEVVDLPSEKARLGKEIGKLDGELAKIAAKLGNPNFLAKAKPEVIEEQRERQQDTVRDRDRLQAAYDRLTAG